MTRQTTNRPSVSRRAFLRGGAAASAGLLLTACVGATPPTASVPAPTATPALIEASPTSAPEPTATTVAAAEVVATLPSTPQCADLDDTVAQTAGPFYTPNTPERTNLREEEMAGVPLLVTGRVLQNDCRPVSGAILDFWHADDGGVYDNVGFRLRGHQFADAEGNYRLETIVPGLYPGRTRHIHVIVQGENTRRLTTQIYWPNEAANARDGIFHPALLMQVSESGDGQIATFDFVL